MPASVITNLTECSEETRSCARGRIAVSLMTGGSDRPYVFGLTTSLLEQELAIDLIGSDDLEFPQFQNRTGLNFMNLRGNQDPQVSVIAKIGRVSAYYARLLLYAAVARPTIFHILWNNKLELFDRTLLMLYYRLLGKKVVLTVHNVNKAKRDCKDTSLNRLTLRVQYRLAHQIFVHTRDMRRELADEFRVPDARVTVIPFGINNAVPTTSLTSAEAKQRLGLRREDRVILFFGRITPYKGLDYLIPAYHQILKCCPDYRLIIAGCPDRYDTYWSALRKDIRGSVGTGHILLRDSFIPEGETEVYFKAADVVVLPYRHIYQSGVLFLGLSFGLPVIAADVGAFREDVIEGETGYLFNPGDPADLVRAMERYFASELYAHLDDYRHHIKNCTNERHSWKTIAETTVEVYDGLLRLRHPQQSSPRIGS